MDCPPALALTESITLMPQTHVPEAVVAAAACFGPAGLAALISLITTIKACTRSASARGAVRTSRGRWWPMEPAARRLAPGAHPDRAAADCVILW
jgi:hypothetical protein